MIIHFPYTTNKPAEIFAMLLRGPLKTNVIHAANNKCNSCIHEQIETSCVPYSISQKYRTGNQEASLGIS